MIDSKVAYTTDLLIFGIDSRESDNLRSLPKKYFSILLVKRNKEPFMNKWCLPGGFVNSDETSKEASIRILKKETSLSNVYMQQVGVYDSVNRDPRGRVISSSYMALIDRTILKEELDLPLNVYGKCERLTTSKPWTAYLKIADEITGSIIKLVSEDEISELKNNFNSFDELCAKKSGLEDGNTLLVGTNIYIFKKMNILKDNGSFKLIGLSFNTNSFDNSDKYSEWW